MRTREQEQLRFNGLRIATIAADLDCTHEHVLNLVHAKKLAAVNIGTGKNPEYRVSGESYKAFLHASKAA